MALVDRCFELLAQGGTVVVANKRMARRIRESYAQARVQARAWPTPDVLPWRAWVARLWDAAAWASAEPLPALLGDALEQQLWQAAIAADSGRELLDIRAAAREAREARLRMSAWRVPAAELQRHGSEESRAFLRWQTRVDARCAREGWIDAARLPDELAGRLATISSALPARVALAGFDEMTPQQRAFLDALEGCGARADTVPFVDRHGPVRRLDLADRHDELETAARWARRLIVEDPRRRIGIVVPDLVDSREDVRRIFTAVLAPDAGPAREQSLPFTISAGRWLSDYPLVHAAFLVLGLARRALHYEELGQLLRSPYFAAAETEATRRALLDACLRKRGWLEISAGVARRAAAEEDEPHTCPRLAESLQQLMELGGRLGGNCLPGEWLPVFDAVLASLGWPGERSLSSHEFQTRDAFRALEQEIYTLGAVTGPMSYADTLKLLQRLAAETMFQPETPAASIEVLGPLEAAGCEFDHLWLAGLHDEVWPPAARPNGFLPASLQRQYGMPHASAQRQLEYTARLTDRMTASGGDVIVSSPRRDGDRELRPSPLILEFEPAAAFEYHEAPLLIERVYQARALERLADDAAPALGSTEPARGGARLLAHQAACPFRAFAEHRLHADVLEVPVPGIDARARGDFLHRALEHLWQEVGGSELLLALSAEERRAVVVGAVRAAAEQKLPRHSAGLVGLEIERAQHLIARLLEIEASRPSFRVERSETLQDCHIGGIDIRTRIDRVDRLANGSRLIIDYKTGKAAMSGWWGSRPDDPQLPLYATAGGQATSGVSFAILSSERVSFLGLARDEGIAPGIAAFDETSHAEYPDWDALLAGWRETLERLARDFAAGRAAVDPKQPFDTCRYCHLAGLCRVEELKSPARGRR
ncbi:MAG: PD-(D/E)XK nuclease family protein [Gammaproteobacteria bacterium]|nr:PD-(D/E)XK nuclease family protein [Gammaproteobacteria bacterium]